MDTLQRVVNNAISAFRPPPKIRLSQWAELYAYLSPESSAEPGKWKNIAYQIGIMDAITDPRVERVTVMKSARVGYTKIIGHVIGYHIHYDPCPIMVVQPTDSDAEGYSKEEIAPMIRDTPVLAGLVSDSKSRDSNNTILQKSFRGGTLSLVGANSPRGFRRVSRRIVIFDEIDGYPPSAGTEGDQIKLGIRRTEYYWNRKIICGSTPTTDVLSRIEPMFEESDKRFYHVPCPHCHKPQVLKFENLHWPKEPVEQPELAYFVCVHCNEKIDHKWKRWMVETAEKWSRERPGQGYGWVAEKKFTGHAGFHIWAAYSFSPNATWGHIAKEFLDAKRQGPEQLKTFVNTVLGETWKEKGEAPDWRRLYDRREQYEIGRIPAGGLILTMGVDVQKDRLEAQVYAWGLNRERWSIDYQVISGDTADLGPGGPWVKLDVLINGEYADEDGVCYPISMVAIDSGFNTQTVYQFVRRYPSNRVIATKGVESQVPIISQPSKVDITIQGKRLRRGMKVWPVGVNTAKSQLYGLLRLDKPTDEELEQFGFPPGYVHFPEYPEEFFKQLTAESLQKKLVRGYPRYQWVKTYERNEALDTTILAQAAAMVLGIDRYTNDQWERLSSKIKTKIKVRPGFDTQTDNEATRHSRGPRIKRRKSSGFL